MADEKQADAEEKSGGGFIGKVIIWGVIFLVGTGTGVGVAMFVLPAAPANAEADANALPKMDIPEPSDELDFIEFDEVTVNLDDPRMSRFFICKFQLQVTTDEKEAIQAIVDKKTVILKNWLISHLKDKKPEDVKGRLGHNTLRREIHDKFNSMLFTDGIERIQDVLIEDSKIQ